MEAGRGRARTVLESGAGMRNHRETGLFPSSRQANPAVHAGDCRDVEGGTPVSENPSPTAPPPPGRKMEKLAEVILAVPDSALDDVISLPFAEGMTMSRAEVMMMTYWNYVYHTGQVAYIQRLYGDVEMHG